MEKNTGSIFIKTNRLILKNMEPKEITQDYINWLNDKEFNKYLVNSKFFLLLPKFEPNDKYALLA